MADIYISNEVIEYQDLYRKKDQIRKDLLIRMKTREFLLLCTYYTNKDKSSIGPVYFDKGFIKIIIKLLI